MDERHRAILLQTGDINDHFGLQALELFHLQYAECSIYRAYCDAIRVKPERISRIEEIPFLPIDFFKTASVRTGTGWTPEMIFESSGTTAAGADRSRHAVRDLELYRQTSLAGFRAFYGDPSGFAILALLPGYLERSTSSLVWMAKTLMDASGHTDNGFFLQESDGLRRAVAAAAHAGRRILLIGVTFALLDLAESGGVGLPPDTIVMETGGMKGRRVEWTREQVHGMLREAWDLPQIHSEYGMTELLSQAYAARDGLFQPITSILPLVREIDDPFAVRREGSGVLNIIDLANRHSCAFVATEDIGRIYPDGSFEVLGRLDHAALRGCSLLTA